MVSGPPSIVYQPPAPEPQQEATNPAVQDAIRKQNMIERSMAGRGSTMLGGGAVSPLTDTSPSARAGARLLGDFGRLGGAPVPT